MGRNVGGSADAQRGWRDDRDNFSIIGVYACAGVNVDTGSSVTVTHVDRTPGKQDTPIGCVPVRPGGMSRDNVAVLTSVVELLPPIPLVN